MLTKITDLLFSIFGLVILGITYPFAAFLIKLDSKGPVFYKCDRVGLNGKIFKMYKFRTMYETPVALGPSVSPLGDPRVTPVGNLLRRTKFNEVPQLINIFKGEMTLFGPRPETPGLAAAYPEDARKIFAVKPGLIGPNQVLGRNEEESYPKGVDPIRYYIEELLPRKLPLDLQYIEDKSFWKNFKLFFQAIWVILTGALSRRHVLENWTQILLFLGDIILCLAAFTIAQLVRFDGFGPPADFALFWQILPISVLVQMPFFIYFGFYQTLIRYLSLSDVKRIAKGVAISSLALITITFIFEIGRSASRGVFIIYWLCLTVLLTGYRLVAFYYRKYQWSKTISKDGKTRALIWGAGDAGELCLRFLLKERQPAYEVMGFIDDDPEKRGCRIQGVKILGDRHQLGLLCQLYDIQKLFVAITSLPRFELRWINQTCQDLGLEMQLFLEREQASNERAVQNGSLQLGI